MMNSIQEIDDEDIRYKIKHNLMKKNQTINALMDGMNINYI